MISDALLEKHAFVLRKAARAGGQVALDFWRRDFKVWEKAEDSSPVSEADLGVNARLREILCTAFPDYGWLSEEDTKERDSLEKNAVFIVDPIDGTRNFVKGDPIFALSIGIAMGGQICAGVVFLPALNLLFEAQTGKGARLNGAPLRASDCSVMEKAKVIATRKSLAGENWKAGHPPPFERSFEGPLSYRLCLVGEGRFDAMFRLGPTWEWDIAAGSLIASEAGAEVTDLDNAPLAFNTRGMQTKGVVAGAHPLHPILVGALA